MMKSLLGKSSGESKFVGRLDPMLTAARCSVDKDCACKLQFTDSWADQAPDSPRFAPSRDPDVNPMERSPIEL
jgi:hypothetical protein